mmetsp:Transcript_31787/g.74236  ORF Transcript_31787/g.74236 Transcript_31787/m.74236 type:complete len:384 (-) Transcript_31787:106-1257(-)
MLDFTVHHADVVVSPPHPAGVSLASVKAGDNFDLASSGRYHPGLCGSPVATAQLLEFGGSARFSPGPRLVKSELTSSGSVLPRPSPRTAHSMSPRVVSTSVSNPRAVSSAQGSQYYGSSLHAIPAGPALGSTPHMAAPSSPWEAGRDVQYRRAQSQLAPRGRGVPVNPAQRPTALRTPSAAAPVVRAAPVIASAASPPHQPMQRHPMPAGQLRPRQPGPPYPVPAGYPHPQSRPMPASGPHRSGHPGHAAPCHRMASGPGPNIMPAARPAPAGPLRGAPRGPVPPGAMARYGGNGPGWPRGPPPGVGRGRGFVGPHPHHAHWMPPHAYRGLDPDPEDSFSDDDPIIEFAESLMEQRMEREQYQREMAMQAAQRMRQPPFQQHV